MVVAQLNQATVIYIYIWINDNVTATPLELGTGNHPQLALLALAGDECTHRNSHLTATLRLLETTDLYKFI